LVTFSMVARPVQSPRSGISRGGGGSARGDGEWWPAWWYSLVSAV